MFPSVIVWTPSLRGAAGLKRVGRRSNLFVDVSFPKHREEIASSFLLHKPSAAPRNDGASPLRTSPSCASRRRSNAYYEGKANAAIAYGLYFALLKIAITSFVAISCSSVTSGFLRM